MAAPKYGGTTYSGSYGESSLVDAQNYLNQLRQALDSGQITVDEFIKAGKPVAQEAYQNIGNVSRQGSKAANLANPYAAVFKGLGFDNGQNGVKINLPTSYQQQIRESLLPANLSAEERAAYINEIPADIDINSDQYEIEKQALRQKFEADKSQGVQEGLKTKALGSLADILAQQKQVRSGGINDLQTSLDAEADRQFSLSQPGIYEDLNRRGLLESSGLGEALAKQKKIYAGDVANRLGEAKYANTEAEAAGLGAYGQAQLAGSADQIQGIRDTLAGTLGLQQQALSRRFGQEDFAMQSQLARQLAAEQRDYQDNQQTGGNVLGGILQGGTSGALAGGAVGGPHGAAYGAIFGAGAGGASQKKGK